MVQVRVAIVGAGFSGVGLAVVLRRRPGVEVTLFERGDDVGGVWRDNTYPGAACDVPSYLYSYSFAPKRDWSRRYAPQEEIRQYIRAVADRFGVTPLVRLGTEIREARWDATARLWRLRDGSGEEHEAEVVVFACGQMSRPSIPDIPGADGFPGPSMHSSRWRHDVDLAGKRVAVVGTGASAIQFVPEIARVAGHVAVYQRSPVHVLPKPDPAYPEPLTRRAFWTKRYALFLQKEVLSVRVNHAPGLMRRTERAFARHLAREVPDAALRARLTPTDRFGCKRILVSDHWYPALNRDDVEVIASRVARIDGADVVAADGERRTVDVLIWGTGFRSTRFMLPLDIVGEGGRTLEDAWADGATAYLGTQVAGFPNLFLTYGPNSNVGHNSILFMIESQLHYIASAVGLLVRGRVRQVAVDEAVSARFNERIQRRSSRTVYATGCTNWFIDEHGRHTQNWPGSVIPFWWQTRWVRRRRLARA